MIKANALPSSNSRSPLERKMYKQILTKQRGLKKIEVNAYQILWKKGIISMLDRVVKEDFTEEVICERSLNRCLGMH